ncbi:MAG: hypothetical protein Fur0034_06870 [Desulfuromonadia bacterium]
MGKGDRRTKRGKIWRGTTGVKRPKDPKKRVAAPEETPVAKGRKGK